MPRVVAVFVVLLCAACGASATDQRVSMPGHAPTGERGSVTLVFSRTTTGVIVSLNGTLVVDGVSVKRLRIDGVESGYADLAIAANGVERQLRVWVNADANTSVPIGSAPMAPKQSPVLAAGLSILALLISQSVNTLLF